MKICDELRQAVLQAAIQGKLTRQRKEDGDARDLLKQIAEEKAKFIKEKKIKKEKLLPEVTEDEVPFDIPENWVWVRLGFLSYQIQYGYNAPAKSFGRIKMVRISDIDQNTVDWENVPFCDINEEEIESYLLHENDLLFARTGGTVGKSFLVNNVEYEAIYAGYLIRTRYNENCVLPKYMKMFMETQLYWSQLRNGTIATAQPNCNGQTLSKMILPLPPLAEQQRIIAKVEKLMTELEELEKIENELVALKEAFPGDMKAALLQAAMQGKLTTQRKEDGNAKDLLKQISEEKAKLIKEGKLKKEKPLAEISEDEIPFNIPENWEWVRLGEALREIIVPMRDKPPFSGNIPWCRIEDRDGYFLNGTKSNQFVSEETIKKMNLKVNPVGTVLSASSGASIGTIIINTVECCTNQTFNGLVCSSGLLNWYLFYYLRTLITKLKEMGTGTTLAYISQDKYKSMLIPLPPLAEQERIVAKLDKLLPLCESLVEN